ncbi:uncharacterized protein LOC122075310 [Macadamia integrifolia]|uniref:uncharacterized protein LOC122075310 n=1 Tax=Macadamia integrifolia TaxID=60698 RepID=UPI001C4FDE18|nr:uncharacterized protein LOC122075310 [Macadamia integrifolia]
MATVHVLCPAPRLGACLVAGSQLPLGSLAINRASSFACREPRRGCQHICRRKAMYRPILSRRHSISSDGNSEHQLTPLTPLETIGQFYSCINSKDLKELSELISNDCFLEDYSFIKAFEGKEEVMCFFEQLMESTGSNVKFSIERICEGDKLTVWTTWHLEWKEKQIPFTRGCSFYECTENEQRLMIKKARVMIESPIKPGALVLTLLKMVTRIFDEFPTTTEKFLLRPHDTLSLLLKIYNIFLKAFIHPLFVFYINLWKLVCQSLGYIFNILIIVLKIFFK